MKTSFWILISLFLISSDAFSQEKNWRLDLFNFFDNTEFGQSAFKIPQTMAGVHVAPEAGVVWDTLNKLNIGMNLLHEFGSPNAIDKFYPTAYYESDRGPLRFLMGAFPRSRTIENYPRLFFQDSISYYRPNINGIFYLQHFGTMYHYAGKMDPVVEEPLHDNLLFLTSAGIDLSGNTCFSKLETNAGWILRLERSRADNSGWIASNGFLMETRVEYKWLGLFNTFYKGDDMMHYYSELGSKLYWGDPTYRSETSDRSDIYIRFLQSRTVDLELTYSLTFMEDRMYHEQMLKLIVNLNSLKN